MVKRVAITLQHRQKSTVTITVCILVRVPTKGRLMCLNSLASYGVPLQMTDGARHTYADSDAINVWCSSGASFAMNRLNLLGFDIEVESVEGKCDDYQDIEGLAMATSAAMFVAYDRTDLLMQNLVEWEVARSSCECLGPAKLE